MDVPRLNGWSVVLLWLSVCVYPIKAQGSTLDRSHLAFETSPKLGVSGQK